MKICEMARRAGVSPSTIRERMKNHPGLSDEIYCLSKEEFHDSIPYSSSCKGRKYVTSDGIEVSIKEVSLIVGISENAIRARIRASVTPLSYEQLTDKAYRKHSFNEFDVPGYGVKNLYWISEHTGVDRGTLRARLMSNPNIGYFELTRPARKKAKHKLFIRKSDADGEFEDYSWDDLKLWYRECGKHCDNALIILRDLLRLESCRDALPIMRQLEESCA